MGLEGGDVCLCRSRESQSCSINRKTVLEAVTVERKKCDFLVASCHWGCEYEKYPLPVHRGLARKMIDNGVDLMIGHHAHLIQAKEVFKGKNIFYGLGNFYWLCSGKLYLYCLINNLFTYRLKA